MDKWKAIKLTLWGKRNIIKMVVAPQFNYISMMLPITIPLSTFKHFNQLIKGFLWEGKRPRITMAKLFAPNCRGGLALPNVELYNTAFEMAMLTRHWRGTDSHLDWIQIEKSLTPFLPY